MNPQNQDPRFSHQNDEYAQQQAEVQRQMQQIMSTDTFVQPSQPKPTLGILALVFAVILPPLGFILAIISILKGFVTAKHKALGLMGVGALVLSLFMTLVFIVALIPGDSSSDERSNTLENLERDEISLKGATVHISIPDEYKEVERTDDYSVWQSDEELPDFITVHVNKIEPLYSGTGEELINPEKRMQVYSNVWLHSRANDLSNCQNPVYEDSKHVNYPNTEASAQLTYTCTGENDGIVTQYKGEYLLLVAGGYEVAVRAVLKQSTWDAVGDNMYDLLKNVRVN